MSVGIGAGANYNELLQMAGDPSNIIIIDSYDELPHLADFISNYFCKQISTIEIGKVLEKNFVRVPSSPSFFRVKKGIDEYYQLHIYFENDPVAHHQGIYESQSDPFPNMLTKNPTS